MDVTNVVSALVPAFAGGFALQRLFEILDPLLDTLGTRKKSTIGVLSVVIAWAFVYAADKSNAPLSVLHALMPNITWKYDLDWIVTILIISAGTEGFNSILKFLEYKKDDTHADANAKPVLDDPKNVVAARLNLSTTALPAPAL
jgi:hypothetical protein